MPVECVNGTTGERLVLGEEIPENVLVVVAAIGKHRDRACDMLIQGVITVEETLRDAELLVVISNGDDLMLFQQLLHATKRDRQ